MTDLLLKDLYVRLPYGVKIKFLIDDRLDGVVLPYLYNGLTVLQKGAISYRASIKNIRPYLRPMSSMTEEEEKVFSDFLEFQSEYVSDADLDNKIDMYDWLNAHHFDYRGLIEKGLAIEAPKDMYKAK